MTWDDNSSDISRCLRLEQCVTLTNGSRRRSEHHIQMSHAVSLTSSVHSNGSSYFQFSSFANHHRVWERRPSPSSRSYHVNWQCTMWGTLAGSSWIWKGTSSLHDPSIAMKTGQSRRWMRPNSDGQRSSSPLLVFKGQEVPAIEWAGQSQ